MTLYPGCSIKIIVLTSFLCGLTVLAGYFLLYIGAEQRTSPRNPMHRDRSRFAFEANRERNATTKLIQGYKKSFAYHIISESCILPYFRQEMVLGNAQICDVFVLTYKRACYDPSVPAHVTHLHNDKTTWTTARNALFYHVQSLGYRYKYHIYLDDDVEIFFTDLIDQFAASKQIKAGQPGLVEKFVNSEHYQDYLRTLRDGKSAWRVFEETLLEYSPASAVINYILNDGFESRVLQRNFWTQLCDQNTEMPGVTPSLYLDTMLMAYHEDALPLLLPYNPVSDHISWFLSAVYLSFRQKAILYKQCITIWKLSVTNHKSRPYPRNRFPPNYLDRYFATPEGSEIKELLRLSDRKSMLFYEGNNNWHKIFFGDNVVCTRPVKFPLHKHYVIPGN